MGALVLVENGSICACRNLNPDLIQLRVSALLEFDELKKKYAQECEQVSSIFNL